ncbi:unnamed protein product, partial [Adineta ricciae]
LRFEADSNDKDYKLLELPWIRRWLERSTHTTKQNLPPFSPSGDINDAVFPMPEYILQGLGVTDRALVSVQSSSIKVRNIFESTITKRPVERFSWRTVLNQYPVDEDFSYGIRIHQTDYREPTSSAGDNAQKQSDFPVRELNE